jgi:hypothetical protein
MSYFDHSPKHDIIKLWKLPTSSASTSANSSESLKWRLSSSLKSMTKTPEHIKSKWKAIRRSVPVFFEAFPQWPNAKYEEQQSGHMMSPFTWYLFDIILSAISFWKEANIHVNNKTRNNITTKWSKGAASSKAHPHVLNRVPIVGSNTIFDQNISLSMI